MFSLNAMLFLTNLSLLVKELYQGIKQGFQTAGQPLAAKPFDLMIIERFLFIE